MSELVNVAIENVDPNPFRQLGTYPYVQRKLDALKRSVSAVGLWEGIIGRRNGNRVQLAFGHHREKAARELGMTEIPIVIRDLTDEQMLQFMGRENMEDYNADFLTMLETWEAAAGWLFRADQPETNQGIDIARLLGWTYWGADDAERMNNTAKACTSASALIKQELIQREDLTNLTVFEALEICGSAQATLKTLKTMAKVGRVGADDLKRNLKHVGKAVKRTAAQSRAGQVAQKDLRGQVDVNAYRFAKEAKRPSPLFEAFGKKVADWIRKMLKDDATSEKLAEIKKALPQITLDDDKAVIKSIDFELGELAERAETWRKRLTPTEKKVAHLQITGGN